MPIKRDSELEDFMAWLDTFPIRPDWLIPAGLVRAVEKAARNQGVGPSDFITDLLDKKFLDWLPVEDRRRGHRHFEVVERGRARVIAP